MNRIAIALLVAVTLVCPLTASAQGLLVPIDKMVEPLALKYHRVNVEIREQAAVTTVSQAFTNHTDRLLEATYVFPVPAGATVADFAMVINGKKVRGEVLPADKARGIYQEIVRRMRDPGLVEQIGQDLFQARVFPIQPGSEQQVEITLNQVVDCDSGVCTYTYPLRKESRPVRTEEDFTLGVTIESAAPITAVYSPTHQVETSRDGEHKAVIGMETERADLGRDFELIYTVSRADVSVSLLSTKPKGGDGFFLLLISPKVDAAEDAMPKDVTFVLDTSGSMAGQKMDHARQALRFCLSQLRETDRFNIVRFATDVHRFSETLVYATDEQRRMAEDYVRDMNAIGGTNIHGALLTALAVHEDRKDRPQIVVFLTDGKPTAGEKTGVEEIADAVKDANPSSARVFVFGVGTQINTILLDRLALDNGGTTTYVRPDAEIEHALSSFYTKVASPVMSGLDLKTPYATYDMYPQRLPDLFAGDQLVVLGRYKQPGEKLVKLSGTYKGKKRTIDNEVPFAAGDEDRDYLATLWASRKVGHLLEQIRLHGENPELVDEVTQLGTTYGLVTPYTSYLVTEPDRPIADRFMPPVPPPMPFPKGGSYNGPATQDASPSPETSVLDMTRRSGLRAESGEGGIAASRAVSDLKEKKVLEDVPGAFFRRVDGRTFVFTDGTWVDQSYEDGFDVLEIRAMSDAYFLLIEMRPDLASALTLGEKILVVTGNRKAVRVSDQGEGKASRPMLERYLK